ncbi:MAG: hypothetical protein J6T10_22800 [Methanobrevibacter sp.]|nr:hypothetical protein [Methanobrevibacter sp.]
MDKCPTLLPRKAIKIRQASLELFKLNAEYKKYEEEYKQKRQELQNLIFKSGYEDFAIDTSNIGKYIRVKSIKTNKIIWDVEKLKQKIGKKLFNKVVNKTYTITDYSGLVKYLTSCGVDPKVFSKYVCVENKVDNKKIDELGELGEILVDDLKGCYEVENVSQYIKFYEVETNQEED